jgi:Lipocalin-like domain
MNRRSMLTATTMALLLGVALSTGDAVGQTAKDLVGTWTFASVETTRADGTRTQPFGANPKGYVMFDGNGRFVYLLTRPGRPKFASNSRDDASPEENKATVQGSLAYAGTYSVSDKTLIFSVEATTFPNAEGTDQKRSIVVTADELRWSNPAPTTGGAGARAEAVLKRVK